MTGGRALTGGGARPPDFAIVLVASLALAVSACAPAASGTSPAAWLAAL